MESVDILVIKGTQQLMLSRSKFGPRMEEVFPAPERGRWGVRGVSIRLLTASVLLLSQSLALTRAKE